MSKEMARKISTDGQGKGKGHGKNPKKLARVSRSVRAGLQSTSCNKVGRVAGSAAVYCAAVMEYLIAEIMELAGNACRDMRLQRLTPRHLMLAIRGVVPHVHRSLVKRSDL
ncbi:hypothetical protein B566_EDAN012246 [Ephemera danica]|nr:hypothetical protein B566_EDAN012246 [Ephemera danica]